jgi:L-lactate dehydrogenase (cytochrome)/(S)-mandelate dehydrogenase
MGRGSFRYRLSAGRALLTVEDYRRAARRAVPDMVWAYIDGGAEDHVTLRRNSRPSSAGVCGSGC